ncbi:hypothetical protein [Sulfitobacter mediterraneus]|uniref:Uncharacterized protein n=1 Tax=Sulfitobacter mediterraneus TaxID=83219 RepID=A0A2T6CDY3_9RHOB|nr:hypothetical protein [Sulfitobacter mediterraneus]PTX73704.1 hypothetical protein C8N31_106168 [Sulfitobacter mediterraneus]
MKSVTRVTHVSRRWALSGLSASMAVAGFGKVTYAEGAGESNEPPSSSHNIDKTPPKKKSKKISVIYTQKNLKNVKDKDLKTAIRGNSQGHSIVIEGFSKRMSSVIFELILVHRRNALKVIGYMGTLTAQKDRRDTLKFWRELWAEELDYLIGIRDNSKKIDPNNPELAQAKRMVELATIWLKSPMEGVLKKPQKKKPAKKKSLKNAPKKTDSNAVTDFFTNLTGTEAPQNEEVAGSR